jgi:hypothetical protein
MCHYLSYLSLQQYKKNANSGSFVWLCVYQCEWVVSNVAVIATSAANSNNKANRQLTCSPVCNLNLSASFSTIRTIGISIFSFVLGYSFMLLDLESTYTATPFSVS